MKMQTKTKWGKTLEASAQARVVTSWGGPNPRFFDFRLGQYKKQPWELARIQTWYRVPEVLLKPSEKPIEWRVNPTTIPKPIGSDGHKLDSGFHTRHVTQEEFAGELFRSTEVVGDSLWGFLLISDQDFFQFCFLTAIGRTEVLVVENIACQRSQRLDMSGDNFVQVFKLLKRRKSIGHWKVSWLTIGRTVSLLKADLQSQGGYWEGRGRCHNAADTFGILREVGLSMLVFF